jgi:hypothetical protein
MHRTHTLASAKAGGSLFGNHFGNFAFIIQSVIVQQFQGRRPRRKTYNLMGFLVGSILLQRLVQIGLDVGSEGGFVQFCIGSHNEGVGGLQFLEPIPEGFVPLRIPKDARLNNAFPFFYQPVHVNFIHEVTKFQGVNTRRVDDVPILDPRVTKTPDDLGNVFVIWDILLHEVLQRAHLERMEQCWGKYSRSKNGGSIVLLGEHGRGFGRHAVVCIVVDIISHKIQNVVVWSVAVVKVEKRFISVVRV